MSGAAEVRILGTFEVLSGQGTPLPITGRQARALLALLVVQMPESVSSDRLLDELWHGSAPSSARHALQVYASRIRAALRDAGVPESALLNATGAYHLSIDPELVDAHRFERLVGVAQRSRRGAPADARQAFIEALGLWRGPALAEFEDVPALAAEAIRLRDLRTAATEGLAETHLALGEPREAVSLLAPLVADSPLSEHPRALLMRALYRAGRHAEALQQYAAAVDALAELGLHPGRELRDLQEAILRHDDRLAAGDGDRDPGWSRLPAAGEQRPRSPRSPKADVPAVAGTLVGRAREIRALRRLLVEDQARLVTLQGPGGCGKTRLSVEIGVLLADDFEHGSSFVELAPLDDHWLVVPTIARQLRVAEIPGRPLEETLVEWLADREILLVIDNFEHVMEARTALARLLAGAPGLSVLVTSREALYLRGEYRFDLTPLPTSEAAELFLRRAREIRPEIGQAPGDREALHRICQELDGLPLALELVAARAALFSLPALAARLGDRLDVEAAHDAPPRQRTLRDTIEWSYRMLPEHEQRLMRVMSSFLGGARIESIEAVIDDPQIDAVEGISALVSKSLLRRRDDEDGSPRLAMLVTIWDYAREMLERAGEADGAGDRHAEHFLRLAQEADRGLYSAEAVRWLGRFDQEEENLRLALTRLLANDPAKAAELTAAMGMYWDIRGTRFEARERLLAALPAANTPLVEGRLRFWLGRLQFRANEMDEVPALLEQAHRLARQAGDVRTEVYALSYVALLNPLPDGGPNLALFDQALERARLAGDDWALVEALGAYGDALQMADRADQARDLLEEALAVAKRIGNPLAISIATSVLGEIAARAGEVERAESLFAEGLSRAREIGLRWLVLSNLGDLAVQALRHGDLTGAARWIRQGVAEYYAGDAITVMGLLAAAATLAAIRGHPAAAAQLWACFDGVIPEGVTPGGGVEELRERWLTEARALLDDRGWERASRSGGRMTVNEAVELAASVAQP